VDEAAARVRNLTAYEEVDNFAKIDHQRGKRTGLPEVVFGQGKTDDQIVGIMQVLARETDVALVTRVDPPVYHALQAAGLQHLTHYPVARLVALCERPGLPQPLTTIPGKVVVCTAGTADLPVAEEAATTAELMGVDPRPPACLLAFPIAAVNHRGSGRSRRQVEKVVRLWDVGVAGLQRLLKNRHIVQVPPRGHSLARSLVHSLVHHAACLH
jgi:NCAIR mutase (PurE)-related protein